jgi:2-methylcitrate dehydratase PrpD
LTGVQAIVEAQTSDGSTFKVRCDHPRGSPENRLSRAQIEDKFRHYAKVRMAEARIEKVIEAVSDLENLGSVRTLMDLLSVEEGQARRKSAVA